VNEFEEITFSPEDVPIPECWKAHEDAINCVTFIKDLNMVASCSFDRKVYIWNPQKERTGSLVLGNRATPPEAVLDNEQKNMKAMWKINVDKDTRFNDELSHAAKVLDDVDDMNYDALKAKYAMKKGNGGVEEETRTTTKFLKGEMFGKNAMAGLPDDEYEGMTGEEKDKKMLQGIQ